MKEKVMNGLEKFSKAMLSPLSYISAAGLILVLGALLTSTSLSAMIPVLQWTPIKLLGQLIYNCIMVIINNLSLMFCVGIAAALAKKNKQHIATDNTFDSQPVHICRGHFRHVSEDRPLFGRPGCHGRFWIQAHVRGDKQNGIVVKDYELSPPPQGLDN